MNKNYMTYPMKYMRITCRYDKGSHRKHCINVKDGRVDYPIDDGGKDIEKDPIYCPCDEMIVTKIQGVGNSNDWYQNSNGSWAIVGNSKKPEDVFYIDSEFTQVLSDGNLMWKYL